MKTAMEWDILWQHLLAFAQKVLIPGVVTAVIGILAVKLLIRLTDKLLEKKQSNMASALIRTAVRAGLYILLFLTVLTNMGLDVSGVVALASVLTLAVSLSLQNVLTNVFSGMTLLYTKPFIPGHFVTVDGKSGTVREVGLIYTKLTTPDNKIVSIPNSNVVSAEIVNFTETGMRRMEISVSASYDAPTETVLKALEQAAQVEGVLDTPAPKAHIENYGDNAIEYTLFAWAASDAFLDTQYAVRKNIKCVFDRQGVEMTYPHLNVHIQEAKQ